MRTKSTARNIATSVATYIVFVLLKFLVRNVLIIQLGKEFLGLNGLFINIISVFSLAELGFGSAISFSLYRPLAERDQEKIKSYVRLYRRIYSIVGVTILLMGVAISPFLQEFIKGGTLPIGEVRVYFLLTVVASAVSYFNAHKVALITADQKTYVEKTVSSISMAILSLVQCAVLLLTSSFAVFLMMQAFMAIVQNVTMSIIVNRSYPYILERSVAKLGKEDKGDLFRRIRGLVFHKVGGIVVNSSTSMLISMLIGISTVGEYSNYNFIISVFAGTTGLIFNSFTASVGNLLAVDSAEAVYTIFRRVLFINFWMNLVACACLCGLLQPFILLWLGPTYTLDPLTVALIITQYGIASMLSTIRIFKEAAGLYYRDRYKPVIESIINIGASIVLAKVIGVAGIFVGSILGMIATSVWTEPFMVYKYSFKRSPIPFYFQFWAMIGCIVIVGVCSWFLASVLGVLSIGRLVIIGSCIFLFINIALFFTFRKTADYLYLKDVARSLIFKKKETLKSAE